MDKLGYLYKAAALPVGNHMFKGSPFQELVKLELNAFGETTFQVDYECLDATLN